MPPPTLVSYTEVAAGVGGGGGVWNAPDTPRSTASVAWQTGDILVALAGDQDGSSTLTTPTATGLTFTSVFGGQIGTDASHCAANIWVATAGSNGSSAVTFGWTTGSNIHWGAAVWVWRGSGGAGNNAGNAASITVSLIRSGANSTVVGGVFDWNATATTGYGWTPTVANDRRHEADAGSYSIYVADWGDQGSAGTTSYGITGITGGPFANVVVEITAAGAAVVGANIVQAAQPFPPFKSPFREPNALPFQLQGDQSTQGPVAITLSDTGAATDAITVLVEADPNQAPEQVAWMFLEPSGASFQLQGDASTNAPTLITLLDAGTGSDALTVTAAVPLTDAGAGVDTLSVSAAVPLTDAGAGNDSVTVAADVPLTDAGTGTDSISVNTGTDSYQAWPQNFPAFTAPFVEPTAVPFQLLGDRSTGIVLVSLSDTGTGDDTLAITAAIPLTDTAVGADSLTLTAAVPLGDTGAGADALAAMATVPLGDVGTGDDQISILTLTVTDPNQAPLQRFGWGLLRPDGHIPFQLLGDANAHQPETGGGTLTVTDRVLVTFGAGDRDIADLRTGVREVPTLGGGE